MSGCSLSHSSIQGCKIYDNELTNAILEDVDLSGSILVSVVLKDCKLMNCNLRNISFLYPVLFGFTIVDCTHDEKTEFKDSIGAHKTGLMQNTLFKTANEHSVERQLKETKVSLYDWLANRNQDYLLEILRKGSYPNFRKKIPLTKEEADDRLRAFFKKLGQPSFIILNNNSRRGCSAWTISMGEENNRVCINVFAVATNDFDLSNEIRIFLNRMWDEL